MCSRSVNAEQLVLECCNAETLTALGQARNLQRLSVYNSTTDVLDSHVEALVRACPKLENLSLNNLLHVTDAGFMCIARGLPRITMLALRGSPHVREWEVAGSGFADGRLRCR